MSRGIYNKILSIKWGYLVKLFSSINLKLHVLLKTMILSSGYSQSASLRSSTPNNCSAVYQEELALLLIQASPHPLLIAFRNPAGDLLDLVKIIFVNYMTFCNNYLYILYIFN